MMLRYGIQSLWNRRFVAALTVVSIALSVALLLGVERLRTEARAGFANSASGIDLIVAARGNPVQILLATVFGVGSTGAGLRWDSFEMVRDLPAVAWAVPISMGDNHRGFPVIGTTAAYFEHFRHSGGRALDFARGGVFADRQDVVIGAELAARFDYGLGAEILVAHGAGAVAFDVHDEAPFRVSGVLTPTGTAVDRMLFVSLAGFDGLHRQRKPGKADPLAGLGSHADHAEKTEGDAAHAMLHAQHGHAPESINAIYVGLTERSAVLSMQRLIANHPSEPLTAVLPNVALLELWSITGTAETALRLMAVAVVLTGLIGMIVMLSATLEARRREFGILRSVGAPPLRIFGLIVLEASLVTTLGLVLGYLLLTGIVFLADPLLAQDFGLRLGYGMPSGNELLLMLLVLLCSLAASLVPALRVYRMTLADGLTLRL